MGNVFDENAYAAGQQSARTMGNVGANTWLGTTGGVANTYTATASGVAALVAGQMFTCKFNIVSSGASTLNINGLGAKPILVAGAAVSTDLAVAKAFVLLYDGTSLHAIN